MHILVIEGNADHRKVLSQTLGRARGPCPRCVLPVTFEVETVETSEEAERRLRVGEYDFVILDLCEDAGSEVQTLVPLMESKNIPYVFYTNAEVKTKVPVLRKPAEAMRLDLATRVCDYYHSFMKSHQKV